MDLERPLARLDADFEPIRRLGVVLLDSLGLMLVGRDPGLIFRVNLARLFERSVECAILSVPWPAPPRFQVRPAYDGDSEAEKSALDALVQARDGALVVDAKYATQFSKQHLYQVLAYMKMVGASRGALVYPAGADLGARTFRARGAHAWDVHVLELDPVLVARDTARTLMELGAALAAAGQRSTA